MRRVEKNAYDRHLERISAYASFYGTKAMENTIRIAKQKTFRTDVDVRLRVRSFFFF